MKEVNASVSYTELLAHKDYLRLWLGQVVSFGGDALTRVALPIYVFELTGNPAALGGAFAIQQLPWILVSPFVGVIVDRLNRKKLLTCAILLEAITVALILLTDSLWQIYLLAFIASVAQVVNTNTRQAAIPDVTGVRLYSRAVALGVITVQTMDIAGTALAGAIVASVGPKMAMTIDVLTFIVNATLVTSASIPQPLTQKGKHPAIWQDIKVGFDFIRDNPALRFVIMIMFLRGITMIGVFPLFVDFVKTDLRASAFEFGLLSATASLGYVLASILAVRLEQRISSFYGLVWFSALAGLFIIPFGLLRSFPLLLTLRLSSALLYGFGNLIANVKIANLAPSEVRGRVSSLSWALIKLSQVTSSVGFGFAANVFGTPSVIALAGLCLCVGSGIMSLTVSRSVHEVLETRTQTRQ